MAGDQYQEKTEQPTSKRLNDARKKGQVAQSREIPSAAILLISLGIFYLAGAWMLSNLSGFMGSIFQIAGVDNVHDIPSASHMLLIVSKEIFYLLLPLMLAVLVGGITANIAQFGFLMSGEALSPKISKFNPINGLKKFVSLKSLAELIKSILKIMSIGGVAYLVVKGDLNAIPSLMQLSVFDIFRFIGWVSFKICSFVCLLLIVLSVIDFVYQRWEHKRGLKMTKQEVKDERKQTEGDPKVKARIRGVQMEMARRRMMEAVPEADVVITNPVRLAIALKFDSAKMIAPRVTAKGAGPIAKKIREIARENDVPLVENKPLAQTIFKAVEIGDFIPEDLYKAVAEILAYVYRLKGMR